MTTQETIQAYRDALESKADAPGYTYDQFDHARKVQTGQAILRNVPADFHKNPPHDLQIAGASVPEDIRYALTYVEGRGWCLWATTREGTNIVPRDRDWHPLANIRVWERVGWNGIHVKLNY